MAPRGGVAWLAGLLLLLARAGGELVRIEKRDVPPGLSLEAAQLIYAFSPGSEKSLSPPAEVIFNDIRISTKAGHEAPKGYGGITVALIPWDEFSKLTQNGALCSAESKAGAGGKLDLKSDAVVSLALEVGKMHEKTVRLPKAGVYAVSFANCGSVEHLEISGTISVKNAHGYLGGNDSGKVVVYGAVTFVLLIATVAWLCIVRARSDFRHYVHHGVTIVSAVALANSMAWLVTFSLENQTGEAGMSRRMAEALVGLKAMYTVNMVQSLALGLGVTKQKLEARSEWIVIIVAGLFGLSVLPLSCAMEQRQMSYISMQNVLYVLVPTLAMAAGILCWVFRSLASTIRRCKDLSQAHGLALFQKSALLVILTSLVMLAVSAGQMLEEPGKVSPAHVFLHDVAGNLVFCASLAGFMYLWVPGKGTFLGDTYAPQAEDDEEQKPFSGAVPTGEEDDVSEADEHDILADEDEECPGTGPSATTIGALKAAE